MTDGTDLQPTSLTDLKPLIKEFISRLRQIENEIETLNDDKKQLFEEFAEKVDVKELKAALRVHKIEQKVSHRYAFDTILECLNDPT